MTDHDEQLRQLKYIRSNTTIMGLMLLVITLIQVGSCLRSL
jgi:hypothetical protein